MNNFKNNNLIDIKNIINLIDKSIKNDPEQNITGWNIIKDNYDEKIDKYRNIINNWKDFIANYQNELSTKTEIKNLKIKYTNVWGYFIEIPKKEIPKITDDFVHKQTLANAGRFITSKLKEFEQILIEWEFEMASKEYEVFCDIRKEIANNYRNIKNISENIAHIDLITSLSKVAYKYNYCKPEITENFDLEIHSARHPVIEQIENDFISNSLKLNKKKYIHTITWPNMWWKSTFLRQNALIILMAHIGSFIPAKMAKIPLTDKIFSRIGAGDNLFLWQSTFLVEMQEMANILNNCTKQSFIIIDEIGRWTSTYDWMSLAWAILKYLENNKKVKTLFATHYHELIDESKTLSGVENFSVAVSENNWEIIFLRKVIKGWAKKSYWIEVAKIAWLSEKIITESKNMLKKLELSHKNIWTNQLKIWEIFSEPEIKIIEKKSEIEEKIKNLDINNLSPIEALNFLNELKK